MYIVVLVSVERIETYRFTHAVRSTTPPSKLDRLWAKGIILLARRRFLETPNASTLPAAASKTGASPHDQHPSTHPPPPPGTVAPILVAGSTSSFFSSPPLQLWLPELCRSSCCHINRMIRTGEQRGRRTKRQSRERGIISYVLIWVTHGV